MSKAQGRRLKALIRAYVLAYEANSWYWIGEGDPADWPAIKRELREARSKLYRFIESLTWRP